MPIRIYNGSLAVTSLSTSYQHIYIYKKCKSRDKAFVTRLPPLETRFNTMPYQGPFASYIMINQTDNYCASCTCDDRGCHCAEATSTSEHESAPCPQCDCGDCQCKNMYKSTGWAKPTVGME